MKISLLSFGKPMYPSHELFVNSPKRTGQEGYLWTDCIDYIELDVIN